VTDQDDQDRPVVHDRRRIDPRTGAVRAQADPNAVPGRAAQAAVAGVAKARSRETGKGAKSSDRGHKEPASAAARASAGAAAAKAEAEARAEAESAAAESAAKVKELEAAVAERTSDLQRLQAEYANYRKRVERDRQAVKDQAVAGVLNELLSVLDDIGRAREHDELTGGFKSVAEAVERVTAKFGLEKYGDAGEAFDPTVHEALIHNYSADVSEATASTILQPGYRVGDRILRPARVAVTEPEPEDPTGGKTND